MTLPAFVAVVAVLGFFVYIGMQLFPVYQEYYAVRTAMKSLSGSGDMSGQDPQRLQDTFFRRLDASYALHVTPENVQFEPITGGWRMHVRYEARRALIANLDVVGKFDTVQDLVGRNNGR